MRSKIFKSSATKTQVEEKRCTAGPEEFFLSSVQVDTSTTGSPYTGIFQGTSKEKMKLVANDVKSTLSRISYADNTSYCLLGYH